MKTLLIALTFSIFSGCSGVSTMNQDFTMTGNANGIRAYNDGIIGVAKTSKEKPDAHNQYFEARKTYEENITTRENHPSFWEKLTSSGAKGS